jgi:hypothetical protein
MSALGPKQTWAVAPHMSAFGGRFGCSVGVVHHPAAQSYFNGLQEFAKTASKLCFTSNNFQVMHQS